MSGDSKEHPAPVSLEAIKIKTMVHFKQVKDKFEQQEPVVRLGIIVVALFVCYVVFNSLFAASGAGAVALADGAGGAPGQRTSIREPATKQAKRAKPHPDPSKFKLYSVDKVISADLYSQVSPPMQVKGSMVICPDMDGNKGNKKCGKGYAEYRFKVPSDGTYYVYVQTLAKNIRDNSLWVSPPLDVNGEVDSSSPAVKGFYKCPTTSVGPLAPHKHLTKKKQFLCCPKYLAANAKKGQNEYYSQCCISTLGDDKTGQGCVVDLEIGNDPIWQLVPRQYPLRAGEPFVFRMYMREDGTAATAVYVSQDGMLSDIS